MPIKKQICMGLGVLLTTLYIFWLTPGWWNLGFSVINTIFLLGTLFLFKKIRKDNFLLFLTGASAVLGWFMAVRNFEFVRFLGFVGIFILDTLIMVLAKKPRAKLDLQRILNTCLVTVFGTLKEAIGAVNLFKLLKIKNGEKIGPVVTGVILAIPLLLVFGGLFYSADPIFAKVIDQIKLPEIKIDERLVRDAIFSVAFFGLIMSMLGSRLTKKIREQKILKQITETNVAVAILEILFAAFAFIQIKYFFASAETLKSLGVIYSEYTRRGYTEMIIASALAYGIVLWLDYSIRSQKKLKMRNKDFTRILSLAMIGEIAIFVMSATKRNYLYQAAYGYTRIRLLGFSLSAWMTAMLGLILYKIVREKKADFFTRTTIVITTISVILLNVLNIDKTVITAKPANLGREIDIRYLSELSDDAYMGWELILNELETRVAENKIADYAEYWKLHETLDNLKNKEKNLKEQADNNWQSYGAWNYASAKSLRYLTDNMGRIIRLENSLEKTKNELADREERAKTTRINENLDKIYNALSSKYTEFYFAKPYGNGIMAVVTQRKLTTSEKDKIDQEIGGLTNYECVWENYEGLVARNGNLITYKYQIRCD